jgi:hypothetical protein
MDRADAQENFRPVFLIECREFVMKTSRVIIFAFLLAGCASQRPVASLSAEQATTVAIQLANDRASKLYQCQPFRKGEPARLIAGQWVWASRQGVGRGDIQAMVDLALDGPTNQIDLQLFYNQNLL